MKKSLKFRLTFTYTAGFIASLLICFVAIYCVMRYNMLRAVNKKLDFFVREFQYEYLTADLYTTQHTLLHIEQIPETCIVTLRREMPGFEIFGAVVNPERRVEILGKIGGAILHLHFSHDNSSIESADPIPDTDRTAHMHLEFNEESYGEGKNRYFFTLISPENELLARSPFSEEYVLKFLQYNYKHNELRSHEKPLPPHRHFTIGMPGYFRNQGVRMRTVRHIFDDGNVLLLAANLYDLDRLLNRLLGIFGVSLIGMLTLSLGIGRIIADKVGNAINRVTSAAREIGSGDYTRRIPYANQGLEIDRLVAAFNDMTANTEYLLTELKTISDNIAHDLRTPLTRMRGKAELSLLSGDNNDSELASVVAEECGDMLEMINTMLEITQTECRFDTAPATLADFRQLVSRSLELFSTIAEDKQIALNGDLPDTPVPFLCHEPKIQRMLANLLDNALKFTPPGGTVTVSLWSADVPSAPKKQTLNLTISDTGIGIPPADQAHIFDRFYRSSASRTLPGNGLGLSLVRAIVLAHNGVIKCESVPGKGTVFKVGFVR